MKFIIALVGIFFSHQVYGLDCDSLEKLTNDDDFNECVVSGVWSKPLLYGEKYDLDTNEDCEWVVGVLPEVKQFIESGSDADVIRDQFKLELCGSLTNPEKKQKCLDLSDKYYKRVIVLLFLGVPYERIAGLMSVCNKIRASCDNAYAVCQNFKSAKSCGRSLQCSKFLWTTPEFTKAVSQLKDNSRMCTECKLLVTELQEALANGTTRQEIIDDADNICERFFSEEKCEEYVGEYIGEILMLLEDYVSPDLVCSLLQMCTSSAKNEKNYDDCSVNLSTLCEDPKYAEACDLVAVCADVRSFTARQQELELESISDEVICEGCEALMATLREYLGNAEVVQYIEQEADQLCQYCPEQKECETLINAYLPQIIAMIQNYLNPVGVCQEMGLCGQNVSAITNYLMKPQQFRVDTPLDDEICPDGQDCKDSETCCSVGGGDYGCCPFSDGVCCEDLIHCCPQGYQCEENYCMRASAEENPGFDFAFPVDIKTRTVSMSRPRRQAAVEQASVSEIQLPPSLQVLMNMGQLFLSQLNTQVSKGACTACNLVMKHRLYEMPLNQEEVSSYVTRLQEKVCKEASAKGVECPSIEGIQAILEAAKEAPPGSQCPIKELCYGSPLQSLSMQFNDVMCLIFEGIMSRLGEEQSWTEMEEVVLQLGEKNAKLQAVLVQTIEKSKLMYANADAASKVEIIREQVYNYLPELKKCEKPKQE